MINNQNTQMVSLLLESSAETASSSRNNDLQDLIDVLALVSDVSSSSSDSEELEFDLVQHPKVNNFVNTIDEFNDENFKSHMRLRRQTIEYLICMNAKKKFFYPARYSEFECGNRLNVHSGRSKVDSRKSVYIYIWYISNTVTFRQLGNLFGVSKSSAWNIVRRVTSFLIRIAHEYLQWPQGAAAEEAKAKFVGKKKIPGIIGAIDCTHIGIKAPKLNKECYFDRKQTYSIVLQAIVDANKRFINISCGEPGSLHDSTVLRRSEIYAKAQTHYHELFPDESFVIGDSAYPATSWLVPPFKDCGNLSTTQRNFNKIHSGTRIVVENAFGLLKGRFRRLLKFTEQTNLPLITNIIVGACVLHNICIDHDDLYSADPSELINNSLPEENNVIGAIADPPVDRRAILFNYLQEQNLI